jgi:hypothetical protein
VRVLVCGGRDHDEKEAMILLNKHVPITAMVIIHGGATGADAAAEKWAAMVGLRTEVYKADWVRWGRAAGSIRNGDMLKHGKPDIVVALEGGPGTADVVNRSRRAGLRIIRARVPIGNLIA